MVREIGSYDRGSDLQSMYLHTLPNEVARKNILQEDKVRLLGSVYTPPDFAQFLSSWAIRHSEDKILDIGIGEGVFTFAAYDHLISLGASHEDAQQQVFGAEIDVATYIRFQEIAQNKNIHFDNLKHADFFETDFPLVDAIIGNPPYVRRTYIEDIDVIRQRVVTNNLLVSELNLSRMTDMYIYFLLHALPLLKPSGRLAVITADSWMNASYGEEFKKYLQCYFNIERLITLDQRVFLNAQVKPVFILATKKEHPNFDRPTQFVRVKNGMSIRRVQESLSTPPIKHADIAYTEVKSSGLEAFTPWGIHFKAPEIYEELESHRFMNHMIHVAETRIGLQTLAKDFFVFSSERMSTSHVEPEFLEPLAQSTRYFKEPVIDLSTQPPFYLFVCPRDKEALQGTHALEHITWGETTTVEVRGKHTQRVGYHNKERIKRTSRLHWYDLGTSLERRGRASILIPRLVYRNFTVLWNQANFVPGELFIEFLPPPGIDVEVYLALLNSSLSEFMLRTHAQVYGGGTFNINPGKIKNVPIVNPALLVDQQRADLKQAYVQYLADEHHSRAVIDTLLYEILGINASRQEKIHEILADLIMLAVSSKKSS